MPTHGTALPPTLLELASSLLVQSRHKASNLKADEEIARSYACAHIACDRRVSLEAYTYNAIATDSSTRLKVSLDLPPIEPRPPIPPRVYKKLYAHLDDALPNSPLKRTSSGRVRTPSSKLRDMEAGSAGSPLGRSVGRSAGSSRPQPSKVTPSKEKAIALFKSPAAHIPGTPTKSTGKARVLVSKIGIHPWIHPTIRFICKESGYEKLAPIILAGMDTTVAPGGRRTRDEWIRGNLTGLLMAFYFFVTMKVKHLTDLTPIGPKDYVPARKEIIKLAARAREGVDAKRMNEEDFWEGWQTLKSKDFDKAVENVTKSNWLNADWFKALQDLQAAEDNDGNDASDEDEQQVPGQKIQVRRADTMFQERYDYLSDARRQDYKVWKDEMLKKIEGLEANVPDAMELDT